MSQEERAKLAESILVVLAASENYEPLDVVERYVFQDAQSHLKAWLNAYWRSLRAEDQSDGDRDDG